MTRIITCSICKKKTPYDNNPFRPFCSERCKMIDLGNWASGDYAVPGEPADQTEESVSFQENNDYKQ